MPQGPTGAGTKLDALALAEMGAQIGALTNERGAAAALIESIQIATIQVVLQQLPEILTKVRSWEQARFQRLMTAVRGLPEAPLNQGLLGRMLATQPPINSYVDRAEVIRLIQAAMSENPQV